MSEIEVKRIALAGGASIRPPVRKAGAPRPRRDERFLKGPVPWDWLAAACQLPGACARVALALWFVAGLRKAHTVRLGSQITAELGVSRDAKRRALDRMEAAGLVSVERQERRAPLVTLLEFAADGVSGRSPSR